MRPLMLRWNRAKIFCPKNGKILAIFGVWGSGVRKSFDFYCKRHIYTWYHVVCDIPRENWLGGVTSRSVGEKNKESHKRRIFRIFTQKPPLLRSSPNLFWGWFPGCNQLCQISFQSVQGFWFCRGSNFGLSHRNEVSPLTQGLNYRSACDMPVVLVDMHTYRTCLLILFFAFSAGICHYFQK